MTSPLSSETRRTWPPDCRRHPLVFGRLCKRGDAHSGTRGNNDASQASDCDCDSDRRRHLEDILQQEKETQTHASIRSNSAAISRARQVSSKCDHRDRRSTKRKTSTTIHIVQVLEHDGRSVRILTLHRFQRVLMGSRMKRTLYQPLRDEHGCVVFHRLDVYLLDEEQ